MANVADAKKQLATQDKGDGAVLIARVEAMKTQVARVLPKGMDADRMVRIGRSLVQQVPGMAKVSAESFLGAFMTCNQLGLEPGGPRGHAWIIPREVYKDRQPTGLWEAHFQLGYKGALVLARRSGLIRKIVCRTVYEAEVKDGKFDVHYEGADEIVRHTPILVGERGKPVLYYCMAKLATDDGGEEQTFTHLRPEDVEERHRKVGRAANSPAWTTHYETMAWKSCIVAARRLWPEQVDLDLAVAVDGMVRTDVKPEALEASVATGDWVDGDADEWPPTAPVPPSPDDGQAKVEAGGS